MTHIENVEQFKEITKTGTVLVDFFATWCGPCRMLAPVLEELEEETNVTIVKVDVDEIGELAREFGIMSIPTLILFKDGAAVKKVVGFQDKQSLKKFIA